MFRLTSLDRTDQRLLHALSEDPRASVMELTRKLGVARATAQARLDKLIRNGVICFGPLIEPRAIGYEVLAFTTLEIAQGRLADVVDHLRQIPEVLEAHTTTGPGDLHCRVVARTHEHLQDVITEVLEVQGIGRTTSVIALTNQIPLRFLPLVDTPSKTAH